MIFLNNQTQENFMIWKCSQIKFTSKPNTFISIDKPNSNKIISEDEINKSAKLTLLSTL